MLVSRLSNHIKDYLRGLFYMRDTHFSLLMPADEFSIRANGELCRHLVVKLQTTSGYAGI